MKKKAVYPMAQYFILLVSFVSLLACNSKKASLDEEVLNSESTGVIKTEEVPENTNSSLSTAQEEQINVSPIKYAAFHSGGPYDQSLAFEVDSENQALIIYMPFPSNPYFAEMEGNIPSLPGVSFKTLESNDMSGSWRLVLSVPFEYLLSEIETLPVSGLPNGDPLPKVPGGELPKITLPLFTGENVELHLFLGVKVFALYLSSPIDPFVQLTFSIRDQSSLKIVGYLVSIPEKNDKHGGFFLSGSIPDNIAKSMDESLNLDTHNK